MEFGGFDLNKLLKKKYGKDLISTSPMALDNRGHGIFRGSRYNITFSYNEFLLISTDNKKTLEEFKPLLSEVMGGEEPICSYNLQTKKLKSKKDAMPTLEWDIVDPEDRIKEIVNGRAFPDNPKIHDLFLYGGRNIEDYIEEWNPSFTSYEDKQDSQSKSL